MIRASGHRTSAHEEEQNNENSKSGQGYIAEVDGGSGQKFVSR